MIIELQNLGIIKKAEIDLSKKFIVFCGPNNSGKTYASFIIYALTKSGFKYFRSSDENEILTDLLNKRSIIFKIDVKKIWDYRINELNNIKESLDSIFGISDDIVQSLFNDFTIKIIETFEEFESHILNMQFKFDLQLDNITLTLKKIINSKEIEIGLENKPISKDTIDFLSLFLESKIYSLIAFYPFNSSHILPVERNSIYTFSKELSIQKQELIDRAQSIGNKSNAKDPFHWLVKSSRRYPLPIRDGLEIAEDLNNYSLKKSFSYKLAEEIENELLNGTLVISKDGDVQFSSSKAKTKKLPIHLSSSIVKTLSSLVFYLKYIANEHELLIIDEPELNLHPNNQVLLARIFAKLVNNGFRLLISTHSDYIIREINNLIMASNPKVKDLANQLGYKEDNKLNKDDVGAYLFNFKKSNSKNVTIESIPISDSGFNVQTIDDTIDKLNDNSEELFFQIKYGNKENE